MAATPSQVSAQVARNRRRSLLVLGALGLVLALGLGWFLGNSTGGESAPSGADPSQSPEPAAPDPDSFTPEAGQEMVQGRYSAGFENTPLGAASAAFSAMQAMATYDERALGEAATVYHGLDVSSAMVQELLEFRAEGIELTLPEGEFFDPGSFPAPGSYYYSTPQGIAWSQEEEFVQVQILAQEEISDGLGLVYTRMHIHGLRMRWDTQVRGGDWVVDLVNDPIREEFYRTDTARYDLDHHMWTPIMLPEWDEE